VLFGAAGPVGGRDETLDRRVRDPGFGGELCDRLALLVAAAKFVFHLFAVVLRPGWRLFELRPLRRPADKRERFIRVDLSDL